MQCKIFKERLDVSAYPFIVCVVGFFKSRIDRNLPSQQDLIITPRGDLIHAHKATVFLNQGKKGFNRIDGHGIVSVELGAIGMAIESFDYNSDGKMDIVIGNERGKWHLFRNELNSS